MSEPSAPSRQTRILSTRDGSATASTNTRARLDSINRRLPQLTISKVRYLGPGFNTKSFNNPYRRKLKRCSKSTNSIPSINNSLLCTPRVTKSVPEPPKYATDTPVLTKKAKVHESALKKGMKKDELSKSTTTVKDILRQAKLGNRKCSKVVFNPYQASDSPDIVSDSPELDEIRYELIPPPIILRGHKTVSCSLIDSYTSTLSTLNEIPNGTTVSLSTKRAVDKANLLSSSYLQPDEEISIGNPINTSGLNKLEFLKTLECNHSTTHIPILRRRMQPTVQYPKSKLDIFSPPNSLPTICVERIQVPTTSTHCSLPCCYDSDEATES